MIPREIVGPQDRFERTGAQRLIDIDAFNLLHIHLDGGPTYKTTLQDDAPIGDGDFGRQAPKPGRNEGANGGDSGNNCEEPEKLLGVAVARANDQKPQGKNSKQKRREINRRANGGAIAYVLARLEDAIDIGHHGVSVEVGRVKGRERRIAPSAPS